MMGTWDNLSPPNFVNHMASTWFFYIFPLKSGLQSTDFSISQGAHRSAPSQFATSEAASTHLSRRGGGGAP